MSSEDPWQSLSQAANYRFNPSDDPFRRKVESLSIGTLYQTFSLARSTTVRDV